LNKLNQLDATLWKFFIAQRVSNVITFILKSRRLYVGVLFCNDRCLCISVLFVGECLFVRTEINVYEKLCVKLVIYKDHTRTHGQQNIKLLHTNLVPHDPF